MDDGWMVDGWMDGWWMDGWMTHGWMTDGWMEGWIKLGFPKNKKWENQKNTDFWNPQISPIHQVLKRFWA